MKKKNDRKMGISQSEGGSDVTLGQLCSESYERKEYVHPHLHSRKGVRTEEVKVVWREVGFGGVIVRGLMSHKPRKEVDGGTNKPAVMSKSSVSEQVDNSILTSS